MKGRHVSGEQLRNLREQAGLRTAELAASVGCSQGHLKNIEGSNDQPSAVLVHRIARELSHALSREVSLDEFTRITDGAAA